MYGHLPCLRLSRPRYPGDASVYYVHKFSLTDRWKKQRFQFRFTSMRRYGFYPEGSFMCSRNLGLLLSILCVRSKESRCAMNVVSPVISFLWLLLIGGIVVLAIALNLAR